MLIYALVCLMGLFGFKVVSIFVLCTGVVYLASWTGSAVIVWIAVLLEIASFNVDFVSSFMVSLDF